MSPLELYLLSIENVKILDKSINYNEYISLDLSIGNESFLNENLKSSQDFENFITKKLLQSNAKVAYGGYNEIRNLYKRSTIFNSLNKDSRTIHIGLDLWTNANTNVLAALDGTIHSFKFNEGLGNYGPTIIIEHKTFNLTFYTLYGHLSKKSIENCKIGQEFKKGEVLATLGTSEVNGDYAPHLHFQIIENLEDKKGDYYGVCSEKDLNYYLKNCPNPNLLLKIK